MPRLRTSMPPGWRQAWMCARHSGSTKGRGGQDMPLDSSLLSTSSIITQNFRSVSLTRKKFFYTCISCRRERRRHNKKEHIISTILSAAVIVNSILKLLDSTVPVTCWHFDSFEFRLGLRSASFPTVILTFDFLLKSEMR